MLFIFTIIITICCKKINLIKICEILFFSIIYALQSCRQQWGKFKYFGSVWKCFQALNNMINKKLCIMITRIFLCLRSYKIVYLKFEILTFNFLFYTVLFVSFLILFIFIILNFRKSITNILRNL